MMRLSVAVSRNLTKLSQNEKPSLNEAARVREVRGYRCVGERYLTLNDLEDAQALQFQKLSLKTKQRSLQKYND